MAFRNLDGNGDWTFGKGANNYLRGNEAVGLDIRTRILSWVNDCFFDLPAGIDWINRLGLLGQADLLEADIRRIITATDNVTAINDFNVSVVDRDFSIFLNIDTIFSSDYETQLEISV